MRHMTHRPPLTLVAVAVDVGVLAKARAPVVAGGGGGATREMRGMNEITMASDQRTRNRRQMTRRRPKSRILHRGGDENGEGEKKKKITHK